MNVEHYREYAADCIRLAENESTAEDKNLLLNVALAWVRLAHQTETLAGDDAEAGEALGGEDAGPPFAA